MTDRLGASDEKGGAMPVAGAVPVAGGMQTAEAMQTAEGWFHRRATDYVEAQILFHLNQVGVLALLCTGEPQTATGFARVLRLDRKVTAALLDYLFEIDTLLDRDEDGAYSLSPFGQAVISRFSAVGEEGEPRVNMFDVRVGAYGPVWSALGGLLRGEARYGEDVQREGRFAEGGVAKLCLRFLGALTSHIDDQGARQILEVGLTGMLPRLRRRYPHGCLYGLDRSAIAVKKSADDALDEGAADITWLNIDFFDVPEWSATVKPDLPGVVYSLHLHELLARGEDAVVAALQEVRRRLPMWSVLAFEQPRLAHGDRETMPEPLWLYAQSNVLIHHLIGNGVILSREGWRQLGDRAGFAKVTDQSCDYLGYRAFSFAP